MIITADTAHNIYPQPRRSPRNDRVRAIRTASYELQALASDPEALARDADTGEVERAVAEVAARVVQ